MKVIITGASGFLGRYLVNELIVNGFYVKGLGRNTKKLKNISDSKNYTFAATDYSVESLVDHTCGYDFVIHLASQLMERDTNAFKISEFKNLNLLENILISCDKNGIKNIVQTSSISVYTNKDLKNKNESQLCSPDSIYGVNKLMCDVYAEYFNKKSEVNIITLRLARLYGEGDRIGLMFTNFIEKAIKKESITINGTGESTIEYIYIKDVVSFISCLLKQKVFIPGIYNLGSGILYSVKEIAETINNVFDNKEPILYNNINARTIRGTLMESNKLNKVFDFQAKWGLKESINDIYRIIKRKSKSNYE